MEKPIKKVEEKKWNSFTNQVTEVTSVFGSLLFLPFMLLIGLGYGLRAGVVVGGAKTLELFKEWGK